MTSTQTTPTSKSTLWIGRILSAIPVLMLLLSGVMKLVHPAMLDVSVKHLVLPANLVFGIGILEISCTVIYLIPRTAVIGAVLITGYLGGAILTCLRVGDAWIPQIVLGVLVWGGLWLRDVRLRALLPLVR